MGEEQTTARQHRRFVKAVVDKARWLFHITIVEEGVHVTGSGQNLHGSFTHDGVDFIVVRTGIDPGTYSFEVNGKQVWNLADVGEALAERDEKHRREADAHRREWGASSLAET